VSGTNPPLGSLAAMLAAMQTPPKQYLHVGFSFTAEALAEPVQESIKKVFDEADDWLRYSRFCWILWSNRSPKQWHSRLITIPELKGSNIFIAPVDVSADKRYGQLGQFAWDWLNKPRT
jgi:hypothetical protein